MRGYALIDSPLDFIAAWLLGMILRRHNRFSDFRFMVVKMKNALKMSERILNHLEYRWNGVKFNKFLPFARHTIFNVFCDIF